MQPPKSPLSVGFTDVLCYNEDVISKRFNLFMKTESGPGKRKRESWRYPLDILGGKDVSQYPEVQEYIAKHPEASYPVGKSQPMQIEWLVKTGIIQSDSATVTPVEKLDQPKYIVEAAIKAIFTPEDIKRLEAMAKALNT